MVTHEVISVTPSTHLRVEMAGPKMTLGVFSGSAEVLGGTATTVVGKKETLTLGGDVAQPQVAKNVAPGPFDEWDKDEIKYHDQYSKGNALLGSSPGYRISDLNHYGELRGCGWLRDDVAAVLCQRGLESLWQWIVGVVSGGGVFVGVSVSVGMAAVPHGELGLLSGAWMGMGSGRWLVWAEACGDRDASDQRRGPNPVRPHPPMPPGPGKPTMSFASHAPMATSKLVGEQGFVFRKDSAGLGVPRGTMGNLGKISPQVEQHGFVSRPAYAESGAGRGVAGAPVTVRQRISEWIAERR